jgi:hypothetical protein
MSLPGSIATAKAKQMVLPKSRHIRPGSLIPSVSEGLFGESLLSFDFQRATAYDMELPNTDYG